MDNETQVTDQAPAADEAKADEKVVEPPAKPKRKAPAKRKTAKRKAPAKRKARGPKLGVPKGERPPFHILHQDSMKTAHKLNTDEKGKPLPRKQRRTKHQIRRRVKV